MLEGEDSDVDHATPEDKIQQSEDDIPKVPPLSNALRRATPSAWTPGTWHVDYIIGCAFRVRVYQAFFFSALL